MAQNSNVGDPNLDGADGNQPDVSQGQEKPIAGKPQGSDELSDLRKELVLLRRELGGLQSRQDKGQNEVQRFMEEVKQHMKTNPGATLDEAEQAVTASRMAREKDDLLLRIAEKVGVLPSTSQAPAAGNGVNVTDGVAQVIGKAGLDANSAEVIELIQKYGNSPLEFALGVGELKARMANKPQPSASASSTINANPSSRVDVDALAQEMAELYKNPSRNMARINEIGELLKKAGG